MDWENRPGKEYSRQWLLSLLDFEKPIRYFGLPAGRALFEKQLIKTNKVEYLELWEKDNSIYQELKDSIKDLKIEYDLFNSDVDVFLDSARSADEGFDYYNFVWLDYCGPITTIRLSNLKFLAETLLDDSTLAVTFLGSREANEVTDLLYLMSDDKNVYKGVDNNFIHLKRIRAVVNTVLSSGFSYRVKVLPYLDSSPMLLFVFKRKERNGNGELRTVGRTSIEVLPVYKGIENE